MAFSDSDIVSAALDLVGVWIHDPADPAGTARQFPYGKASRGTALDVESGALQFAGRVYPVVDFGEGKGQVYTVRVDVAHGPDWSTQLATLEAFALASRTLMLRDNRGRCAYGTMSGYREDDQDWGTQVAFTFTRGDYVRELIR
ncbi:hypothetical protein [Micromonospora sp. NBC_00421]|uniref:hypothetical protein n=1 Tax=Micromonospora sp. NBC_00421 TaxID=2975976 RepID=UPI002E1F43B6